MDTLNTLFSKHNYIITLTIPTVTHVYQHQLAVLSKQVAVTIFFIYMFCISFNCTQRHFNEKTFLSIANRFPLVLQFSAGWGPINRKIWGFLGTGDQVCMREVGKGEILIRTDRAYIQNLKSLRWQGPSSTHLLLLRAEMVTQMLHRFPSWLQAVNLGVNIQAEERLSSEGYSLVMLFDTLFKLQSGIADSLKIQLSDEFNSQTNTLFIG